MATTEARLFCYVFHLQQQRNPEPWEITIGLALVDGSLKIERIPEAEVLRRVHFAAMGTRAGLAKNYF
jgi:hypothetical protein